MNPDSNPNEIPGAAKAFLHVMKPKTSDDITYFQRNKKDAQRMVQALSHTKTEEQLMDCIKRDPFGSESLFIALVSYYQLSEDQIEDTIGTNSFAEAIPTFNGIVEAFNKWE